MSSNDPERRPRSIEVTGAREHNLRGAGPGSGLDVSIERGVWTAVTGPSGSGKTSLVFDVLVREGERRYLGSQSAKALQFFGKLGRPDVKRVAGLPAPIAVARRSVTNDPRSTVGTQSGALDLLRLLFARAAQHPSGAQLTRSHFSFNTSTGACEACGGIGLEDRVDPDRVVADASRSIREGALRPTLPNGYTVYSQVTLEVMDTICRAHGFDVDTAWSALTDEQRQVVLHGTKRLKVPFGKHSLESRMKWEGITARPREEGYYRGIVPVIEETLLRNRNENVLRYVRSVPCSACGGSRLGALGREARLDGGASLPELLALSTAELVEALPGVSTSPVLEALLESLGAILARMVRLGLGHLAQARGAATLSGGEAQRLRLAAHLASGLGGALFALDEPTLGLHPEARDGLREVLDELVAAGNTLVVVEHDPGFVAFADRALALGPGAGPDGGRVVLDAARAADALAVPERPARRPSEHRGDLVRLSGATLHNLREAELAVPAGAFTAVVGPSGAGKSSLVFGTLLPALTDADNGPFASLWTAENARVLAVDARPMGRSSRSTPATWSGVFDHVRKRFAATDAAKRAGLGAGAFSFNGKAGRCEECEGLGHVKIGLHLYEDSARTCPACGGARYRPEVLDVRLDGRTVADVLALSVDGALAAFEGDPKIAPTLEAMAQLGLGYLKLGAPSTVLSSGEAQRIRLATLLAAPKRGGSLYCFDEPDRGLHPADLARLVEAFDRLVAAGDTVLAITHSPQLWAAADRIVEVRDGVARERSFGDVAPPPTGRPERAARPSAPDAIQVRGARTHSLRGVDVRIPHGGVTAVVGPSGSGKSSLAFDTIAAEAWRRYAETLPFQVRRFIARMPRPEVDALDGLTPTVALRQTAAAPTRSSTLATLSGLGPLLRLAWSRASGANATAAHFRPESGLGVCAACGGRRTLRRVSLEVLLTDGALPVAAGAFAGTKPGRFFTEPDGQHVATMRAATGDALEAAWDDLSEETRRIVLHGAGDEVFDVVWSYARGARKGEHRFEGRWEGLLALVLAEAEKRAARKDAAGWAAPLEEAPCENCSGTGLAAELAGASIAGLGYADARHATLVELRAALAEREGASPALDALLPELDRRLGDLIDIGLGERTPATAGTELSRAELQRVRLAGVLRADLHGVTVVLDEPDAGLTEDEAAPLAERIGALGRAGATVVCVTHRASLVRAADHVIALGPGAGPDGGRVVAEGPPAELDLDALLARGRVTRIPAAGNTWRSAVLEVELPASGLVLLTGDLAGGRRTLERLARAGEGPPAHLVDGRVQATSPLHALGAMPLLQKLFAGAAGDAGPPRAAFSYLSPKGRCPACKGSGVESVAMDVVADLALPCEACGGARYRPEVLDVRVGGRNVSDVLDLPAAQVLADEEIAGSGLGAAARALARFGLGHLSLGRRTATLSGGERRRLALAAATATLRAPALLALDDPAVGLSDADVAALAAALGGLAAEGHLIVATGDRAPLREAATLTA